MPNWIEVRKAEEARALVPPLDAVARRSLRFAAGDYWQNMDAWAGARPLSDAENRAAEWLEIEQGFVPQPLLGEVLQRHVDGVVGREPAFEFVSQTAPEAVRQVQDAFETLKAILIERRSALASATSEPPAEQGFVDARAQLKAEAAIAAMQQALGLPDGDELTDDDLRGLPQPWLEAIRRARELEAEAALLAEANAAVGAWWDKRRAHETVRRFTAQLCTVGRAALRIWIPRGLLERFVDSQSGREARRVRAGLSWQEALEFIYLEAPEPESAAMCVDTETMRQCSVFCYQAKDAEGRDMQRVEMSFLNPDGTTTVRILDGDEVVDEVSHDCGGELYLDEAERPALVTDALQRTQNALNVINSMVLRNGNLAGFPEYTYLNAQQPTVEVPSADAPSGRERVPVEMEVGPGVRNFVTGIKLKADASGKEVVAPVSMHVREPTSPEALIAAVKLFKANIYQATSQSHVEMNADAVASAVSRVQARADYVRALMLTAPPVQGVIGSRLFAVLCLAAFLAQDKNRLKAFKKLRTNVSCHLDAGPLAPDERRVILDEYEKGVRSLETTQILLGTEDVDAELALLQRERAASRAERAARFAEFKALMDAAPGLSPAVAAKIADFDEDDVAALEEASGNGQQEGAFLGTAQNQQPEAAS